MDPGRSPILTRTDVIQEESHEMDGDSNDKRHPRQSELKPSIGFHYMHQGV